jgi:CRISPR-associated protein Csm4
MTAMREAKLTLRPLSPFLSPLQSDTLWGQMAWAIRYTESEAYFRDFVARYAPASLQEDPARLPLVLSAAFPAGMLPVPILWPLSREDEDMLSIEFYGEANPTTRRQTAAALKQIGAVSFVDMAAWREAAGDLSPLGLVRRFFRLELCPRLGVPPERVDCQVAFAECPIFHEGRCPQVARWLNRWLRERGPYEPTPISLVRQDVATKNTINRVTDTTVAGEGSLYVQEETIHTGLLEVWLLLAEDLANDLSRVRGWFEMVGMGGFGAGASVGKGRFRVMDLELLPPGDPRGLPRLAKANGFMVLSAYVPRSGEPREGWYRLRVKRGKLGGEFATTVPVWKKPLLMCEPGSVFAAKSPLAWYGRLVDEMSFHRSGIVQYGIALALPLVLARRQGGDA